MLQTNWMLRVASYDAKQPERDILRLLLRVSDPDFDPLFSNSSDEQRMLLS